MSRRDRLSQLFSTTVTVEESDSESELPLRIPPPPHRHAAPSGPWPWMDLDSETDPNPKQSLTPRCPMHIDRSCPEDSSSCWAKYPQSLFPNWTKSQVDRSGINGVRETPTECVIHHVDVNAHGQFSDALKDSISGENKEEFWKTMKRTPRPEGLRVRALFVADLSKPVLQMLGTKYNIEPFFWSSSIKWIPSRYQEEVRLGQGDHITTTLTFIRAIKERPSSSKSSFTSNTSGPRHVIRQVIDTQRPLQLRSIDPNAQADYRLELDLLAIHMVRTHDSTGSTIISYHPDHNPKMNSARRLHSRVSLAGQSVYWQNIFKKSSDPTFILLTILWYALYAWDEALEVLWEHICQLELNVIRTNSMQFTHELHEIRAHLLHYGSLLEDFRKSVIFVRDTPNPAMDAAPHDSAERNISNDLLNKECKNLLSEIERLAMSREMQDHRLKNVMNLSFSSVNIDDSRRMQQLTEATVRDSAAMKQVAYLTMIFLPASFIAGVFGMNIREINPGSHGSLAHYFETALPLTAVTIWVIIAFQAKWNDGPEGQNMSIWRRLLWPYVSFRRLIQSGHGLPSFLRKRNDYNDRTNGNSIDLHEDFRSHKEEIV